MLILREAKKHSYLSISIRAKENRGNGREARSFLWLFRNSSNAVKIFAFTDEIAVPWCGFNTAQSTRSSCCSAWCVSECCWFLFYTMHSSIIFAYLHRYTSCCALINNVHFRLLIGLRRSFALSHQNLEFISMMTRGARKTGWKGDGKARTHRERKLKEMGKYCSANIRCWAT